MELHTKQLQSMNSVEAVQL